MHNHETASTATALGTINFCKQDLLIAFLNGTNASHTFNYISKQDRNWGHTMSTENTLCKISCLALRHSSMTILLLAVSFGYLSFLYNMWSPSKKLTLSRDCKKPGSPLNEDCTIALYLLWTSNRACTYTFGSCGEMIMIRRGKGRRGGKGKWGK